jgi:hypothetical protein
MARDVEYNYTASDKSGPANESFRRNVKKNADEAEKQSKRVENVIGKGLVQIAETVSPKLAAGLADAFTKTGEVGPAILVGGLVAAAPLIGATISGAIIGAVGLGGVVGGFALAARDPQVQAAAASMKKSISDELQDAATPFVDTSIKGIAELGGAVKKINFKQIFADSAVNAIPIIDGATTAVQELGHAITDIIHNSGPVVKEIGNEIGAFSGAIADGLESIADNGPQGAEALHQIFLLVNGTVSSVFQLVNGLTEVYGALSKISGGGPTKILDEYSAASANVADKVRGMAEGIVTANGAIDANGQVVLTDGAALATFAQQIDAVASAGHSLFDSATQAGAAVDAATAAIKKNGKTLDANTEKGRSNREALSNVASALVATEKAADASGASQEQLNAIAGRGRDQFIKLARQFGLTKTQAANLATEMGLIPAKKKTDFTANTHDAAGRIAALQDQINNVHGKTISIDVQARTNKVNNQLSRLGVQFDARDSFMFARSDGQDVRSRTEAPRQIDVQSTANVTVLLDGKPFRAMAVQAAGDVVDASTRRQKVGKR